MQSIDVQRITIGQMLPATISKWRIFSYAILFYGTIERKYSRSHCEQNADFANTCSLRIKKSLVIAS